MSRDGLSESLTQQCRLKAAFDPELPLLEPDRRTGLLHDMEEALHRSERIGIAEARIVAPEFVDLILCQAQKGEVRRRASGVLGLAAMANDRLKLRYEIGRQLLDGCTRDLFFAEDPFDA